MHNTDYDYNKPTRNRMLAMDALRFKVIRGEELTEGERLWIALLIESEVLHLHYANFYASSLGGPIGVDTTTQE